MKQPRRPKFYTIAEAAKELKMSEAAIYKAIAKGRLEPKDRKIVETKVVETVKVVKTISAKDVQAYRVSVEHQAAGKKTN